MLRYDANRLYLRRLSRWRTWRFLLVFFLIFNVLDVLRIHRRLVAHESFAQHRRAHTPSRAPERVYIASMHFNNGRILRSHWNEAVLRLADVLGRQNVYVSVYESGSWDDSKDALRELAAELRRHGVPHRVETSDVTHRDEMNRPDDSRRDGWVDTPRGRRELRRIPYLARLRNRTLRDMLELHAAGVVFDKVLFLNDVVFTADDVLQLMDTNGGDYAAACSLDFADPPRYYDTFALRDVDGKAHVMQTWPYFGARASRNALVNNMDAVPVASCWNGIVVMPAEPFVSPTRLRFRGVADSLARHHLEGSECCLIHADNPLSRTLGVYVNPRVRVGYSPAAYNATHPPPGSGAAWLSAWDILAGLWTNRVRRWTAVTLEGVVRRRRLRSWEAEEAGNREPGAFCLINEMQVLVENGWAHV